MSGEYADRQNIQTNVEGLRKEAKASVRIISLQAQI
jgi:hypothetical protein